MTSATIFPDTTILIQYQALDRIDWRTVLGVKQVKLVLSTAVLQEIEEIKNQDISPTLAKKAQAALEAVQLLVNEERPSPDYLQIKKASAPEIDFDVEQLDPHSIADLLVATVIDYQRKHALEYVVLFSDDMETCSKAGTAGLEIASLPKGYLEENAGSVNEPASIQPQTLTQTDKSEPQPVLVPSTTQLAEPTPLFKNNLIKKSARPAAEKLNEAILAEKTPATEKASSAQINKLFEVIEPKEEPVKSPITAVEQTLQQEEESKDAVQPDEGVEQVEPASADTTQKEHAADPEPEVKPPSYSPPPFVDIKQEPARPDLSHVDSYHPSNVDATPVNGVDALAGEEENNKPQLTESNPKESKPKESQNLPPITSRITPPMPASDSSKKRRATPDIKLPRQTQSFSFTSLSTPEHAQSKAKPPLPEQKPPEEKAELRLAFEGDESRSALIIHHPEYPSIDEVTENIAQLRRNFPKLAMLGATGGDGIGNGISNGISDYNEPVPAEGGDSMFQRRNTRIKRYNSALDLYYSNSEKYLSEVAEFENLRRRSAQLDLMLINELPDSLKSLYIAIHFPSNLRVFSEDNLPEKPLGPSPPEEPNLDALFDKMRLPNVPIPGELTTSDHNIKMRSRNLAPIEVRWNKGWDVIYSLREIGRDERIPFNPLYIVFNSFEHATSFRIQFRITVASASYEEKGDLETLVRKEI